MRIFLFTFLTFFVGFATLQGQRNCISHDLLLQEIEADPIRKKNLESIERFTREYTANPQRINGVITTIPVVVHVVYKTNTQNISTSQIQTQLDVLNDDFRRLNSDANNTWSQGADSEIEFCLATVDPSGNATSGIQRRKTNKPSFSANDFMKFNNKGGLDAWPAADYLNIWVCNLGSGLLGYAQFPGGSASTDGVVVDYAYFGTIGTATAPFNLGRTGTHEVGHWLNLRHIWGDGGCSVDDFVSDTPQSDAPNYGCASGHVSCSSTDMVENYMDYSDDVCMNLFTSGQSTRMNALFASGGARASLLNSGGCGGSTGGGATCTDGVQNGNETGVDCGGSCAPCATCNDGVQNGNETGVDCGGSCAPCTSCNDGVQNGNETGVDCGGSCAPCATCNDGVQNGNETGVDCGGSCAPCNTGGSCDAPTGLFASNIKPKKARLNWSSASSASSYEVDVSVAGQSNWSTFTTSNTNITISGLSNNQSYDWRVRSVCSGATSGWSSVCNFEAGNSGSGDCAPKLSLTANANFEVYPNPAQDIVRFSKLDVDKVSHMQIFDLRGSVLMQSNGQNLASGVSIIDLDGGIYFIQVHFNDGTIQSKKFVKIP